MTSAVPAKGASAAKDKAKGRPEKPAASRPEAPDEIFDEAVLTRHMGSLKKRIVVQSIIIAVLTFGLFVTVPFAEQSYQHYALTPEKVYKPLTSLSAPNLTNKSILSWATTTITEIMTMGFGDMDVRIPQQRIDFTSVGWKTYMKEFVNSKIGYTFKHSQLVLTTVPSDTPVIVAQGFNSDHVFEWIVQMPVIMTYATNNNVTLKKSSIVTLVLVRVPPEENPKGIAINNWSM